jgi:hypothetical protein
LENRGVAGEGSDVRQTEMKTRLWTIKEASRVVMFHPKGTSEPFLDGITILTLPYPINRQLTLDEILYIVACRAKASGEGQVCWDNATKSYRETLRDEHGEVMITTYYGKTARVQILWVTDPQSESKPTLMRLVDSFQFDHATAYDERLNPAPNTPAK